MNYRSYKFQCLGKTQAGIRCKKTFLTGNISSEITCDKHRDQQVNFQYSDLDVNSPPREVMSLIACFIDDSKDFNSFARSCKAAAKACSLLQVEKKEKFSYIGDFNVKYLPNGLVHKFGT